MILWFVYFILALLTSVLCYVTNPIVVLFCNENGELPGPLHLWQTWDNSCDCSDSVKCAPKIFRYNWEKHYAEYKDTTTYLRSVNRERWFVTCINNDFTVVETLQRYFCRVLWLTRNCAYGWAFYCLGTNVSPNLEIKTSEHTEFVRELYGRNLWGAWKYKNTAPIFDLFGYVVHWNNLLGWKIDNSAKFDTRAMVAIRVAFYLEKMEG